MSKKNDALILELLNNDNYRIDASGTIQTRINRQGHKCSIWRMAGTINQGYLRIKYKYEFIFAHRIIWAKFGDTPLDSILVLNHKDGNKLNNEISNLEQISQKANNQHKKDILNSKPNFDKKLTQEIADQIRLDYESGL